MPTLTTRQKSDLAALGTLIAAISRLLGWLNESQMIPVPLRAQSLIVLGVVQDRLRDAIARLGQVATTEDEIWRHLNDAGLTGEPLALKLQTWDYIASAGGPPPRKP